MGIRSLDFVLFSDDAGPVLEPPLKIDNFYQAEKWVQRLSLGQML